MKHIYKITALSFTALLALSACESTKEQLGLTRTAPDEFAVIKRAPLEMPPDYSLRPPAPGAQRPQEAAPDAAAQSAMFGEAQPAQTRSTADGGESVLLQQAGAAKARPDIRNQVDRETAELSPKEKPVAERLIGWTTGSGDKAPASVVDAEAEAERIKQKINDGAPVTEGETPTIDE